MTGHAWARWALSMGCVALVLGGIGLGYWRWYVPEHDQDALVGLNAYLFEQPRVLQSIPLQNLDGQTSVLRQYQGHWTVVNFGYLSCPDICPTNLATLNAVHQRWHSKADRPDFQVVYITLDPQRDTPKRVQDTLQFFNRDFIGLTGDFEAIRQVAQQLNTVFIHEPADENGQYFVSHSDNLALLNPQGDYVGLVNGPHSVENLYQIFERVFVP